MLEKAKKLMDAARAKGITIAHVPITCKPKQPLVSAASFCVANGLETAYSYPQKKLTYPSDPI
jgi:hypothetical protein